MNKLKIFPLWNYSLEEAIDLSKIVLDHGIKPVIVYSVATNKLPPIETCRDLMALGITIFSVSATIDGLPDDSNELEEGVLEGIKQLDEWENRPMYPPVVVDLKAKAKIESDEKKMKPMTKKQQKEFLDGFYGNDGGTGE